MGNSLFSLLYYRDISNPSQQNILYHYHRVYLKFVLIYSNKDPDDHATSRFQQKVTFETLSDHIN